MMLTCADLFGLQNRRWCVHLLPVRKYVPLRLARHCMSCPPNLHSPLNLNMLCHTPHAVIQMKEPFICPRCKIRYVRQPAKLVFSLYNTPTQSGALPRSCLIEWISVQGSHINIL